ncbi:TPA: hypothetical protein ACPDS2_001175 [Pasteurella multocida]|uniref:hypothetical protein n=1 Tax=Pasteurella multocida TaxID=747 RepID=UPI0014612E27|nr:hypothetical protein [Pasteurella multocida]NMR23206.1 hypothetical protein [Pasteurella multocida]HDR1216380.1 hypothetical protein [Pasteurella multocida]HDR1272498.1 hypothetical protein [Pasteurella multocida]HDR1334124.1 hypothetical protein [Pasteurella multocida]
MKQSKTDVEMTLADLENLALEYVNAFNSFNRKMPEGYHLCIEPNGILLITRDKDLIQVSIEKEYMSKKRLTKKDIVEIFKGI